MAHILGIEAETDHLPRHCLLFVEKRFLKEELHVAQTPVANHIFQPVPRIHNKEAVGQLNEKTVADLPSPEKKAPLSIIAPGTGRMKCGAVEVMDPVYKRLRLIFTGSERLRPVRSPALK